ncbi:LytTR family DNA-binding domain-containing protein [Chitinophaga sp. XS-30]|uniref:LytR/AlgR family response regulator transcription factor n=1 Tax=Chitinophaga sp. XS-30 TaxID=2604421 RepID=UPI0011DDE4F3|nr:LytTR family DNA-binding domain-containing protein [Chitinophaga sp. XS-30]QEH39918.1 response regulator transcription factor [Chitinophaga sp. XS-30]
MNIRCIIVDDEPLARDGMELLVKGTGFLQLVASCSNAMEANAVLAAEKVQLMFLDIQMPRMRGIDLLRSLPIKPLVIITTAYPDFALEGFELNVLDYLVKPITPERFLQSVNRALTLLQQQRSESDHLFIKTGSGFEKIAYADILFIEGAQNYLTIHTAQGKHMTLATFRAAEEQLPPGKFLRVHKSYIVAVDKIQSLSGNELSCGGHKVPVSKNYREALMLLIDQRLIRK